MNLYQLKRIFANILFKLIMDRILNNNQVKFISISIALVAICRLLPHPYNFTPIGAMALFGGTYLKDKRLAFGIPLLSLLVSDLLLQIIQPGSAFYEGWLWVYASIAIITPLGFYLRKKVQRQTIMVASLVSSLLFFFLTNFGVWLGGSLYPNTMEGLVNCYIMAIPFFGGTVMGDLFYNFILFGVYALVKWRFPVIVKE